MDWSQEKLQMQCWICVCWLEQKDDEILSNIFAVFLYTPLKTTGLWRPRISSGSLFTWAVTGSVWVERYRRTAGRWRGQPSTISLTSMRGRGFTNRPISYWDASSNQRAGMPSWGVSSALWRKPSWSTWPKSCWTFSPESEGIELCVRVCVSN